MRVLSVMTLALGVAAQEEEAGMLQVEGHYGEEHEWEEGDDYDYDYHDGEDEGAMDSVEDPVKYTSKQYHAASYGMDVVLPNPIMLTHFTNSELVIRKCPAYGGKKCSSFVGGQALMDSIMDDTGYGYGTAHYGELCCVKEVEQCETKYTSHCNRRKAKDLTQEQCEKVADHAQPLSFQDMVVKKKNQFPGCHYCKRNGNTYWNSFEAAYGYGDKRHVDRRAYAPICTVTRCKADHPPAYKKADHPPAYKKADHPTAYKKVGHYKAYKKVGHYKAHKKVEYPRKYKKVGRPTAYTK